MSIRASISAFAYRGARRRHAMELLLYSGGLVVVLLLLSAWICAQGRAAGDPISWDPKVHIPPIPWNELALADLFAVGALGLSLFVLAPAAVAASLAGERRAGTLDQLRTTPLDPLALLTGFVVGPAARIYLLCVGPLALHVLAGVTGVIPLEALLATLVTFAVGGATCVLIGVVVALAPRQETGGGFVALGVAALLGVTGLIGIGLAQDRSAVHWAFLHPAGAIDAAMLAHDGLWRHLAVSWYSLDKFEEAGYAGALSTAPLFSTLLSLAGGVLLARAACRKLGAPHLPLFSKRQAVALFALCAAACVLPFNEPYVSAREVGFVPLVFGMFLLPVLASLGMFASPTFESWALSLRRRRTVARFSDEAAPHAAVWTMIAVYFAIVLLKLHGSGFPERLRDQHLLALGWAVSLAGTLPVFILFGLTRYYTQATRAAFVVAVIAYALVQVIGIGICTDGYISSQETTFLEIAGTLGLAAPLWVAWRQRVLARKVLAGAQPTA